MPEDLFADAADKRVQLWRDRAAVTYGLDIGGRGDQCDGGGD